MRRSMMLLASLVLAVSGCSMFSAHSDVVEEAAGQKLTADRLSDILLRIRAPIQYDARVGTFVTSMWTDLTLFSQAVASNQLAADSAFIADAMWPTVVQATFSRWVDTIVARNGKVTDAAVDSAWNADKARAVQHILVKADSGAPKEVKEIAVKKLEALLARIKGGESFSKVAHDNTEDPGSKADSGYYGPKPKGQYVPAFDKVLWSMKPGDMSGVITTGYGYHIIRRPTQAESARFWRDSLARGKTDSIMEAYYTGLAKSHNLKVDAGAIPHMRAALEDRMAHTGDNQTLTTYDGGKFTTGDFVHWIGAALADPSQAPDQEAQLKARPDSDYTKMVTIMTQQQLVLAEAKKNHVGISADEWKTMQGMFTMAMDSLKSAIGLVGPEFDGKSSGERSKVAAQKVEEYFNDMVTGKKTPRPLPGMLPATLRERYKPKFNAVAMQHGLDLAKSKHAADSAKAGAAAPPGGAAPIQPAPNGPPVSQPNTPPPPAPKKP